jgi:hypothetical protein
MSYSASSYAVFGIKTSINNINQIVKTRGCKHQMVGNANFCSQCGKPSYIEKEGRIIEPMEAKQLSYFYSFHEQKNDIVIGFHLAETDSDSHIPMEIKSPTTEMIKEILDFCKMYSLSYTEKDIKMYVLTYHSY